MGELNTMNYPWGFGCVVQSAFLESLDPFSLVTISIERIRDPHTPLHHYRYRQTIADNLPTRFHEESIQEERHLVSHLPKSR